MSESNELELSIDDISSISEDTESTDEMSLRCLKKVNYSETEEEDSTDSDPLSVLPVKKILTHRMVDGKQEFYCKFKNKSYRECSWVPFDQIYPFKGGKMMINKYNKKYENNPPQPPYFPENYTIPERIIGIEKTEDEKILYIVKWTGLEYEYNTKEENQPFLKPLITKFNKENKVPTENELKPPRKPNPAEWKPLKKHDKSKSGKQVREYQLEGLNFMVNSWFNNKNAILADEMGLGKTCQGAIFLDYLHRFRKIRGPFLILAPLSTIGHWEREINDWTSMKAISYYGSKARRSQMKKYEFFYPDTFIPKFNVLITTYEFAIRDAKLFGNKLTWQALIIDEAHRIKNFASKLTHTLHEYKTEFKLLLTGTPLQNNIQELWSLLNFLNEEKFGDMEEFMEKYGTLNDTEQIEELKSILKPLMLRRLKSDVEKNLPPLEEVIIECGMTQHQKAYYKAVYEKNLEYLSRGEHKTNTTNLMNISMELRKVCNHPYLLKGAEPQILIERKALLKIPKEDNPPPDFENEALIRSSGKMILLDKLLQKLYKDGHKVLIFSQMTKMLDIIQDFLVYRGYHFERLDGGTKSELRQPSIDRFNAKGSKDFIFMLCTKAGGLGINLTAADTVIIYDSDWNPQNDIQATARCHRIGQTKSVRAYRFITPKSYEKKMFDTASLKLGLDNVILEANREKNIKKEDMEKMLRLGAYYAFEEDDTADSINEEDIDSIISKSKIIKHETKVSAEGSTFSKANFTVDDDDGIDVSAPDFWMKYLPEVHEDEILDGGSIAERRRILRERSEDRLSRSSSTALLMDDDIDEEKVKFKGSDFQWTKKKLMRLQQYLLRYGWGRWHNIVEKFDNSIDLNVLKAVCHIFVKIYIANLTETNPVLIMIYNSGINDLTKDYEKKFFRTHRAELDKIASSTAVVKANRLNTLYFVNNLLSSCKNPPEDIEIPESISGSKPAEWWTTEDDKTLIYSVWQDGYSNNLETKFSNDEPVTQQALNHRVKLIVNTIKSLIIKHSEDKGINLPFNVETIHEIKSKWNRKEQSLVHRALCNFGYPNAEKFIEKAGIVSKTPELVDTFVKTLIQYCHDLKAVYAEHDNKDVPSDKLPKLGILAEHLTVGQAGRILMRTELFEKAREAVNNPKKKFSPEDKKILETFSENGFYNLEENEIITNAFGKECIDGKLSKAIKHLIKTDMPRSSSGGALNIKSAMQKIQRDKNGNPIFPISASVNLTIIDMGTVVYDRPAFHNERYLYPNGYTTEKLYQSCLNLDEKVWYRSTIIDDGGECPIFRVTIPDTKVCFEGTAPSKPWLDIIKAIEDKKREEGLPGNRSLTISGPDCYGLSNAVVASLMMNMPNADKCSRYKKPKISKSETEDEEGEEPPSEEIKEERHKQPRASRTPKASTTKIMTRHSQLLLEEAQSRELTFNFKRILELSSDNTPPPILYIDRKTLLQKDAISAYIDPDAPDELSAAIGEMEKKL